MDDRRHHDRYRLWLPARLEGSEVAGRLAVGHNISQTGSLLVTSGKLAVGHELRIFVRLPPQGSAEKELRARVVRCDVNQADPNGLWPYRVAVEFAEPHPELEELLREHGEMIEVASSRRGAPTS
jgi:hypothetical protein